MASTNISLAPGLGYGLAVKERTVSVPSEIPVRATAEDKELCRCAVDFFIRRCRLGASMLTRKMGWGSEVKTMLSPSSKVTKDDLERLARFLGLKLPELLEIGKQPPLEQAEEFKRRFKQLELVVNNATFAKASFI